MIVGDCCFCHGARHTRSRDRRRQRKNPRLESGVLLATLPRIGLLRVGLARSSTVTSGRAARIKSITVRNRAAVLSCSLALFYFSGHESTRKARQRDRIAIDCSNEDHGPDVRFDVGRMRWRQADPPDEVRTVSAVLANPFATRDQVAIAMEMGRNNGC
jgi:hypothetical protein